MNIMKSWNISGKNFKTFYNTNKIFKMSKIITWTSQQKWTQQEKDR